MIIAHGRSDALAIENAVRVAIETTERNVVSTIRERIAESVI